MKNRIGLKRRICTAAMAICMLFAFVPNSMPIYAEDDITPPTVISITCSTPAVDTTISTQASFVVTFSEAVTGVDNSGFLLTTVSGTASGVIQAVENIAGTFSYIVIINNLSGHGKLRLDLKDSGTGIADTPAGNAISGGFASGTVISVNETPPVVTGVTPGGCYNINVNPVFDPACTAALTKNGAATPYILGDTISAEGSYVLTVSYSETLKTAVPFVIDKTRPALSISRTPEGAAFITIQPGETIQLFRSPTHGISFNDLMSHLIPYTPGELIYGNFYYVVKVTDAAGNTIQDNFTVSYTPNPNSNSIINFIPNVITPIEKEEERLLQAGVALSDFTRGTLPSIASGLQFSPAFKPNVDSVNPILGIDSEKIYAQYVTTDGSTPPKGSVNFKGEDYNSATNFMAGLGILVGSTTKDGNTSREGSEIKRAQVAKMLDFALGYGKITTFDSTSNALPDNPTMPPEYLKSTKSDIFEILMLSRFFSKTQTNGSNDKTFPQILMAFTMPIPPNLQGCGDDIGILTKLGNSIELLPSEVRNINGVPCICGITYHNSPYLLVGGISEILDDSLAAGESLEDTAAAIAPALPRKLENTAD